MLALECGPSLPDVPTLTPGQDLTEPIGSVTSNETCPADSTPGSSPSSSHSTQLMAPHRGLRSVSLEDVLQAEGRQASLIAQAPIFDMYRARSCLCGSHWVSKATTAQLRGSRGRSELRCVFGMFRHGGVLGVTQASGRFPGFLALFVKMIEVVDPAFRYTSLALVASTSIPPHRDTSNCPSSSLLLPIKLPRKGLTVWTEVRVGDLVQGPLEQLEVAPSQCKVGHTTLLKLLQPHYLDARRWHATYSTRGGSSLTITAYSLMAFQKASPTLQAHLTASGLPLPTADNQQGGELKGGERKIENLKSLAGNKDVVGGSGEEAEVWEGDGAASEKTTSSWETPPGQGPCGNWNSKAGGPRVVA